MTARDADREKSMVCFILTHTGIVSTGSSKSLSGIGGTENNSGRLFRSETMKRGEPDDFLKKLDSH